MTERACVGTSALLTVVLLILFNGVFAMSEMAVVASRRARLRVRVRAGDRSAKLDLARLER